jgi:hypothetical protein
MPCRAARPDLLGGLNQPVSMPGRRVALVGALHGAADDCTSLQIDFMLGLVREARVPTSLSW